MLNIIRIVKAGGSLAFNMSKFIKNSNLKWQGGDNFIIELTKADQITITKINVKELKRTKELELCEK